MLRKDADQDGGAGQVAFVIPLRLTARARSGGIWGLKGSAAGRTRDLSDSAPLDSISGLKPAVAGRTNRCEVESARRPVSEPRRQACSSTWYDEAAFCAGWRIAMMHPMRSAWNLQHVDATTRCQDRPQAISGISIFRRLRLCQGNDALPPDERAGHVVRSQMASPDPDQGGIIGRGCPA
jgi:hypothetical protein